MIVFPAHADLALEMLCTLSTTPASMKDLQQDFGTHLQQGVRRILEQVAAKYSVQIISERQPGFQGNYVRLHPSTAKLAKRLGEEYWKRMYG